MPSEDIESLAARNRFALSARASTPCSVVIRPNTLRKRPRQRGRLPEEEADCHVHKSRRNAAHEHVRNWLIRSLPLLPRLFDRS